MNSWFSERVNKLVRDAPQVPEALRGLAQIPSQPRTAEDLASELERDARRVSGPQEAIDLVSKWVERSDNNQGIFPLASAGGRRGDDSDAASTADPLTFYEGLLRSHGFEALIDACGRAASLRAELLRSGGPDAENAPLTQALRSAAERLLLPGALALWPTLLVLVAGSSDSKEKQVALPYPKCGPWARRALALLKRRWQSEALPAFTKRLDRELTALACQRSPPDGDAASSDLLRQGAAGKRISKGSIRTALAKERLQRRAVDAERLRSRTVLLCDLLDRVRAAEGADSASTPQAERLLDDADEMLVCLDAGVKVLMSEQEALEASLAEVSRSLEMQIDEAQATSSSFAEKRTQLSEERTALMRRLEEVNMHIAQIDEASAACDREVQGLRGQLRETTNNFREKIAGSFCQQKRLADEKLRAVACKECAHTALDVIRGEERRRCADLAAQRRRRCAELRRTCAAYVHQERLRLEAAVECATAKPKVKRQASASDDVSTPKSGGDGASTPKSALAAAEKAAARAAVAAQEPWQAAQAVMRRVEPLLSACAAGDAEAAAKAAAPASATASVEAEDTSSSMPTDAQAFFASAVLGQCCVDCGLPDADWASVSYGTYLCVDCAGRHRGLGVHLSFVRSTTMDIWSPEQLRRMQLGGTRRFQQFLESYPRLKDPPRTSAALAARYGSRAAAHYRQLLDARCEEGGDPTSMVAPLPEEGHLLAITDGSGGQPDAEGEGEGQDRDDSEAVIDSLEEEFAELREAFMRQKRRLDEPTPQEATGSDTFVVEEAASGDTSAEPLVADAAAPDPTAKACAAADACSIAGASSTTNAQSDAETPSADEALSAADAPTTAEAPLVVEPPLVVEAQSAMEPPPAVEAPSVEEASSLGEAPVVAEARSEAEAPSAQLERASNSVIVSAARADVKSNSDDVSSFDKGRSAE
eukprot:CAMPEP_0117463438 /NCGR_PEP_ID=MMETSP0784-20121206/3576_1 /TAXON_ID=39447 /ORGANISM="" /LENGTH=935 /DNA_ID=CAMNT_0005257247 /DNA_START=114 /DNA_END=2919 /DNA_ORIENTATION=+